MYHNGFRDYDPFLGRYTTPDPVDPTRINATGRAPRPLQDLLFGGHGIEVPVLPRPMPGHPALRVSARADYTAEGDERLAAAPGKIRAGA